MTAPPFAHPDTWTPDEHAAARCACGAAVPDAPGCECHGGPPAVCDECNAEWARWAATVDALGEAASE